MCKRLCGSKPSNGEGRHTNKDQRAFCKQKTEKAPQELRQGLLKRRFFRQPLFKPGKGSCMLNDVEGMRQPCTVKSPLADEEDLGLVLKILECLRIEYPVAIPLKAASVIVRFVSVKRPAKRMRTLGRIGGDGLFFYGFEPFTSSHGRLFIPPGRRGFGGISFPPGGALSPGSSPLPAGSAAFSAAGSFRPASARH